MNPNFLSRRDLLKGAALTTGTALFGGINLAFSTSSSSGGSASPQERIHHSVCRWCYNNIPLEELAEGAKNIGITSIELTTPEDWPTLKAKGLTCAMGTHRQASLTDGFNDPANHAQLKTTYIELVRQAASHGVPNVIVFSGNRRQLSDAQGIENCARGLEPVVKEAERQGVKVVMELLNSKRDHKDYQCDHTPWGAALVDKLGSDHFKLLYDIYHMQIMEGDVIATIRQYKDYIAHYHTGGVPGRHEINDSQELHYPAIMRAIVETGFTGFVAQEFIPTYDDKLAALAEGVRICDI